MIPTAAVAAPSAPAPGLLPYAVVAMVLALVLYTIGVWGAKLAGRLRGWQLAFFWCGLASDTVGTALMWRIAGRQEYDLHALTGQLAIVLMALHATWATIALALKREGVVRGFHRFSIPVWLLWLVPFFSGAILAVRR
ncbi:MAG: HsmA family protein [Gemmatimonadota bacterium]